jgi:hypothetical protein
MKNIDKPQSYVDSQEPLLADVEKQAIESTL